MDESQKTNTTPASLFLDWDNFEPRSRLYCLEACKKGLLDKIWDVQLNLNVKYTMNNFLVKYILNIAWDILELQNYLLLIKYSNLIQCFIC